MYLPILDHHAWDIDAGQVGSHCSCLASNGSSQGDPKNQAMQLPHHSYSPRLARDALALGCNAALNRDPTPVTSVSNTSETVPQPSVSQSTIHLNLMYLYQDLNRRPSTIDGYRRATVDTLGPVGHHILKAPTLIGYFLAFTGIIPKVPGIFQSGTSQ